MSSVIGLISTNYTGEHYGKLIEDRRWHRSPLEAVTD